LSRLKASRWSQVFLFSVSEWRFLRHPFLHAWPDLRAIFYLYASIALVPISPGSFLSPHMESDSPKIKQLSIVPVVATMLVTAAMIPVMIVVTMIITVVCWTGMVVTAAMITVMIIVAVIITVIRRTAVVVTEIIAITVGGTIIPCSGIIRTARQNKKKNDNCAYQ
jgi:hypothetical protein